MDLDSDLFNCDACGSTFHRGGMYGTECKCGYEYCEDCTEELKQKYGEVEDEQYLGEYLIAKCDACVEDEKLAKLQDDIINYLGVQSGKGASELLTRVKEAWL